METILITGGTGLIGKSLIPELLSKGYHVRILSRTKKNVGRVEVFQWNIDQETIDPSALKDVDHIIHLAGENVGDGRWTTKRKKEIFDSRIKSQKLILDSIKNPLKTYISAGGISIYGVATSDKIFSEEEGLTDTKNDFLADISLHWENAATHFKSKAERVVILRTPIVLAKTGALQKMAKPIKMGIGSALGSGEQYVPWVHIDDIVNAYLHALENTNMDGAYNVAAHEHLTNQELTTQIAKALEQKLWLPKVPRFLLKLMFGEMAGIILEGSRVHNTKLVETCFKFKYPNVKEALENIYAEPK